MLANMMHHMKIAVTPEQVRVRNVASVSVSATLSPFHRNGGRIDVQVASMGDAFFTGGQLPVAAGRTRWHSVCHRAGLNFHWGV